MGKLSTKSGTSSSSCSVLLGGRSTTGAVQLAEKRG